MIAACRRLWPGLAAVCLLFAFLAVPAARAGERVNLNTASAKELQQLPFIGEKRARAIVRFRDRHGPFDDVEQLLNSPAVGKSTFEAIRPYLTLSGAGGRRAASTRTRIRQKISTTPGQIIMLADEEYYPALAGFLQYAARRVDISMFLFKTTRSKKNRANKLVKDLIAARKRGVAVRVLLENSGYDEQVNKENKRTARKLQRAGITVRFDSRQTTTHTKIVVIDERFCFVGSHNFTGSALYYNHEMSLLVDSPVLATDLIRYMAAIR